MESRVSTIRGLFRFVKARDQRRRVNVLKSKQRFQQLAEWKKTFKVLAFRCSRRFLGNSTYPRIVDTRLSVNAYEELKPTDEDIDEYLEELPTDAPCISIYYAVLDRRSEYGEHSHRTRRWKRAALEIKTKRV